MDKCTICLKNIADENKLHDFTHEGEGCCKTCWDWLKTNFPLKVDEEGD